jgi:hypothetical protein
MTANTTPAAGVSEAPGGDCQERWELFYILTYLHTYILTFSVLVMGDLLGEVRATLKLHIVISGAATHMYTEK